MHSIKKFGSIYNFKDNTILPPSLNPSHQGREAVLLPLDGLRRAQSSGEAGWG